MKVNKSEEASIITVEEIKSILINYRIGKKPLAKLLGWGETTIIRYIEGDVPTSEYSDKLKAISNNPGYYYEILMKGRENLTNVAYRKSRQAVLDCMMESRISVAAQHIVNQCHAQVCTEEVLYYLYYAQSFSLAMYDVPIFEDEYKVEENLMPYPELYQSLKSRILVPLEIHDTILSANEKLLIDCVIKSFRWYGMLTLEKMVLFERSMMRLSRDKDNQRVIAKPTLKAYFQSVLDNYSIQLPGEIEKYPDRRIIDLRNLEL